MSHDRRQFLKLLSVLPLVPVVKGCSAAKSPSKTSPDVDTSGAGTGPQAAPTPTPKTPPPKAPEPSSYATQEDVAQTREVAAYGQGMPEDPQCPLTGADVKGPFHRRGAPARTSIAGAEEPGERIRVVGRVLQHDCKTPVKGAVLDVWHADARGRYDNESEDFRLRGQLTTDERGAYAFETIKPGFYPLGESMRPAHIHFNVSYPGCHPLTTQLYFKGDPHLGTRDPCDVCNSADQTLIVAFAKEGEGDEAMLIGTFDIILAKA